MKNWDGQLGRYVPVNRQMAADQEEEWERALLGRSGHQGIALPWVYAWSGIPTVLARGIR